MTLPNLSPAINLDQDWTTLVAELPVDLDASAFRYGAMFRKRGVPDAATLLRLTLAYACSLSLREVTTWAAATGVARLSPPSLHTRLMQADAWMGHLVTTLLAARTAESAAALPPLRLRIIDGTMMTRPGKKGADWRLLLGLDLRTLRLDFVSLTGVDGGESFTRVPCQPGDVLLGDRAFGTRQGIAAVVDAGADVLVRLNWKNVPLHTREGQTFDLFAALRTLAPGEVGTWEIQTAPTPTTHAVPGRLIVRRLLPEEADRARQALKRTRRYGGVASRAAMDIRTFEAVEYMILFTTVPPARLTPAEAIIIYRFRWQVELAIKRLKSLCALDSVPTRKDTLGRTVLTARLLLALLADTVCTLPDGFSPWLR